jgi:hypothetical protein
MSNQPLDIEAERVIYEHFKRLGCFDPAKETSELIEVLRPKLCDEVEALRERVKELESPKIYEFNLNNIIHVKLNEMGYKILAERHNSFVGRIPKWETRTPEYYEEKADAEGYTKFQAWEFVQDFGEATRLGMMLPYDTNILINSKDIRTIPPPVEPTKGDEQV